MDLELARTFLAVADKGSFIAASQQLHVTQTTVTARIKNLEEQLKSRLFLRTSQGASLTEQGRHFVGYAQSLLATWETAQREILSQPQELVIRVAAETSLWSSIFHQWVIDLKQNLPQARLATYVSDRADLLRMLEQGEVDILLLNAPCRSGYLSVEMVLEEKLVLIEARGKSEPYIYIDWGESFAKQHRLVYPEIDIDKFTSNMGPLALETLSSLGGRGYFRSRTAQPYIDKGIARVVEGAPEFLLPVYAIYSDKMLSNGLLGALSILKHKSIPDFCQNHA